MVDCEHPHALHKLKALLLKSGKKGNLGLPSACSQASYRKMINIFFWPQLLLIIIIYIYYIGK